MLEFDFIESKIQFTAYVCVRYKKRYFIKVNPRF